MEKIVIRPFNVVEQTPLPEISVEKALTSGDSLEIDGEVYYVCELINRSDSDSSEIGVIPLVVRNPSRVRNIQQYIECLSIAHRKVLFKNSKGMCDLENCDEMIVT
jgi:hypothetical protein